jgi:hypothetical protein
MLVTVVKSLSEIDEFIIESGNIKEILNTIKFQQGKEYTDSIIYDKYSYIVADGIEGNEPVILIPEVLLSDISMYPFLYIIADIKGEEPISATAILAASISLTGTLAVSASTAAIIATIANIAIFSAIGLAASAIITALSPTPSFSSDPSNTQSKQSSLFNGAPLIREQGGSVPMVFGNPFCGGVLISSGVTTEDIML